MSRQETEKIKTEKSLGKEAQDDYLQFLSEWRTSAIALTIGLVAIGGIALLLLEGGHMWKKFF